MTPLTAATIIQMAYMKHRRSLHMRLRDTYYGDDLLQGLPGTGLNTGWVYWNMKWRAPGYGGPTSEPGNTFPGANDEWNDYLDGVWTK